MHIICQILNCFSIIIIQQYLSFFVSEHQREALICNLGLHHSILVLNFSGEEVQGVQQEQHLHDSDVFLRPLAAETRTDSYTQYSAQHPIRMPKIVGRQQQYIARQTVCPQQEHHAHSAHRQKRRQRSMLPLLHRRLLQLYVLLHYIMQIIHFISSTIHYIVLLPIMREIRQLMEKVAYKLKRPIEQLAIHVEELQRNWFQTKQSLLTVTDEQFIKMGIPMRLAIAIREAINEENIIQTVQQMPRQATIDIAQLTNNLLLILSKKQQGQRQWLTIHKIIKNIIQHPNQQKFRLLKKSNQIINKTVFAVQSNQTFFTIIGFYPHPQGLYLPHPNLTQLNLLNETMQSANQRIQAQNPPAPKKQLPLSQSQQFSAERLAQANYKDLLDKLLQRRNAVMRVIPSDRKITIYHKRYEEKSAAQEYNLSQISDDKLLLQYYKEVLGKQSKFKSRRKEEFQYLLKQPVYKETNVRIKLPNQYIVDAVFAPMERMEDVFRVVSQIVIGNIYLYTTPPVKRVQKEMKRTLLELECVPSATFYLGVNEQWYIQEKYWKNALQ